MPDIFQKKMYSQVLHGMRPFVAPPIRTIHREHDYRPRKYNANAIEIWRAFIIPFDSYYYPRIPRHAKNTRVNLFTVKPLASIYYPKYHGAPKHARHPTVITDTSPWHQCAALHNPTFNELII